MSDMPGWFGDNSSGLLKIVPGRGDKEMKQNPSLVFSRYFHLQKLESVAISRFKWDGLPDGLDSRTWERMLHYGGMFAATEHLGGLIFARAANLGQLSIYGEPTRVTLTCYNSVTLNRTVDGFPNLDGDEGCVYFYPSICRQMSGNDVCMHYADRLTDLDMLLNQNIFAQAMPYILETDPRNQKDLIRYMGHIYGWKPFVAENDAINMSEGERVRVQKTGAPVLFQDICITKHDIMQEFLTVLGIDNSNTDKRERVQSAEAMSNNEEIMINRRNWLQPRKEFCEKVNALYGSNLSVTYDIGEWSDTDEFSWISEGDVEQNAEYGNPDNQRDNESREEGKENE